MAGEGEPGTTGRRDRAVGGAPTPQQQALPRGWYRVRIEYTEPEFQARTPDAPPVYHIEYDCPDAFPDEAERRALDDYNQCACSTWVMWRREIHAVRVAPIDDGAGTDGRIVLRRTDLY